jgi:hypothetical protein
MKIENETNFPLTRMAGWLLRMAEKKLRLLSLRMGRVLNLPTLPQWLRARRFVSCAAGVVVLSACGSGIDTAEWTEDVKLHDGSVVVVWRKERARSDGFPNDRRGGYVDFEFTYKPMGIHWADKASSSHVRNAVSFDVIDGVAYLVLYGSGDVCIGRPGSDYSAEFLRWENGTWITMKQADFPIDKLHINLLISPWGRSSGEDAHGRIKLEKKLEKYFIDSDKPDSIHDWFRNFPCKNARTPASTTLGY